MKIKNINFIISNRAIIDFATFVIIRNNTLIMYFNLILVTILIFIINIPFGYWRDNVKKFSLQWVLAIHLPVPLVILLRIYGKIGFAWPTYIFLVSAFFLGQYVGSIIHKRKILTCGKTSSCLVMDLLHHRC